jgi:cyclic di-GMP phosphodiesterase Gmr
MVSACILTSPSAEGPVSGAILLLAMVAVSPILVLLLGGMGFVIARQRRRLKQLEAEARHDLLTGLPNRRGLKQHWDDMAGEKALLLIDLVGFKAVNDSHGHVVGDALLKQVSARLKAAVPPPGILARWGGDEFVAVVPACRLGAQLALIADAREAAYDLSDAGGPADVRVGARIGVGNPQAELGLAIRSAARNLLEHKAAEPAT